MAVLTSSTIAVISSDDFVFKPRSACVAQVGAKVTIQQAHLPEG